MATSAWDSLPDDAPIPQGATEVGPSKIVGSAWDSLPDDAPASEAPPTQEDKPWYMQGPGADASGGPGPQGLEALTPEEQKQGIGAASSYVENTADAGTFGFSDEMVGLAGVLRSIAANGGIAPSWEDTKKAYFDAKKEYQTQVAQDTKEHPDAAMAGQVTGLVGSALLAPEIKLTEGAGLLAKGVNAAATGATYGGLNAAGQAEGTPEEQLQQIKEGAEGGAVVGGIVGTATGTMSKGADFIKGKLGYIAKHGEDLVAERELEQLGINRADMRELGVDKLKEIADFVKKKNIPLSANTERDALEAAQNISKQAGKFTGDLRDSWTLSSKELRDVANSVHNKADELFGANGNRLTQAEQGRYNMFQQHVDLLDNMSIEASKKPVTLSDLRTLVERLDEKIGKFNESGSVADADRLALRQVLNKVDNDAFSDMFTSAKKMKASANRYGVTSLHAAKWKEVAESKDVYKLAKPLADIIERNLLDRVATSGAQTAKAARAFGGASAVGGLSVGAVGAAVGAYQGGWKGAVEGGLGGGLVGAGLGSRPVQREASEALNKKFMIPAIKFIMNHPDIGAHLVTGADALHKVAGPTAARVYYNMMKAEHPELQDVEDESAAQAAEQQKQAAKAAQKKAMREVSAPPATTVH